MQVNLDANIYDIKRAILKRLAWLKSRGKKRIKPPPQIYPSAVERRYGQALDKRAKVLWSKVEKSLLPHLPALVNTLRHENGLPTIKTDAGKDDLDTMVGDIRASFYGEFTDKELEFLIRKQGLEVNEHTLSQFRKQYKTVLGLDPLVNEPWLAAKMTNYVSENVNLIESIDSKFFAEVEQVVFRGAAQGLSSKDLAEQIRDRFDVSHSRFQLIARDQVGKLTGQLNQARQQNAGFSRYIWRTSRDNRVRPEHEEREGEVFDWDSPPDDGHPGQPIQCRCYAEPIFEDLVDETTE